MFRFSSNILISRAPADVWRVLIGFPHIPAWEQGVIEVRQVSPGAPGVGTTLVTRRVNVGCETLIECRITDWEELRGAAMSLHSGPLRHAFVRYAVEPAFSEQAQTIVTYTAEGELQTAPKFLTPSCLQ